MKTTGYLKVTLFGLIVFGGLWYLTDISASDLVKKPELVVGLTILLIAILFNGKIVRNLREIKYKKLSEEEQKEMAIAKNDWYKNLIQKLTKTKPIAEESDILMDHSYDGILELDNDLPPWWVYSFYMSIIFAIGYLGYYHIFDGDDQIELFNQEMLQAKIDVDEYKKTAVGLIDASTVELLTDAGDLASGKAIFTTNCAVCHLADGGGNIGPNLTDKHWILGGGIKNVFTTVSEGGRDGKGMIPWKSTLKAIEIAQVASYIISLDGTTPAKAKAPEGDIWEGE
ncbi:MAG: c-type cytochrome [Flavobacteriaceae bacterium]|nr:c-type cytochrome [Flavobacteriaceae bacterium]